MRSQIGMAQFQPSPTGMTRPRARAFSAPDLLIAVGIIAVLSALLLTGVSRARMAAQSTHCQANLHAFGVCFTQYAMENDGRYPTPLAAGRSWESLLQPYLRDSSSFHCLSDEELFPAVGSSYDWRDTPNPMSTLAGRRMSDITRYDAVLAFESLPGWHGRHLMNAVYLNGSVALVLDDVCLGDLQRTIGNSPASGNMAPTVRGAP
jgi:type II secretory pathway pseudopilin PulG